MSCPACARNVPAGRPTCLFCGAPTSGAGPAPPAAATGACAAHPRRIAVVACAACRAALCEDCRRALPDGRMVCPRCADKLVTAATGFCAECLAESSDATSGDVGTTNGCGSRFYGGADECPRCASIVRTCWITVLYVPLVPLGSYRYREGETTHGWRGDSTTSFLCRRRPLHGPQVLRTWLVAVFLVIAILGILGRRRS